MRIAVIVPTTGGPRLVQSLTPLNFAPRSVMRAVDDYVPLPTSARYHAFLSGESAMDALIGPLPRACDLRLTGGIETGRSWEFPVALAHWLVREGHDLVIEDAEVIVWATGALDTEARLIAQDYHIADKARASREMIASVAAEGACLEVLLPRGAEAGDAPWPKGHRSHVVRDLSEALAALSGLSAAPLSASSPERAHTTWSVSAAALGLLLAGGAGWWVMMGGAERSFEATALGLPVDAEPSAQAEETAVRATRSLSLIALRAPEARICEHVRIGMAEAEEVAMPVADVDPITLPYDRLCGLAVSIPEDGVRLSFAFGLRFLDRTSMTQASVMQAFLNPGEVHRYWFIDFVPPNVPFTLDVGPADGSAPGSADWQQISFEFRLAL